MHTAPIRPLPEPDVSGSRQSSTEVRDELLLLWRQRVLIAGLALVLGAAGAIVSVVRTRQFEATATVSVSASRLTEATPARVSPETFVPLMTTPAVAAAVIDELTLGGETPTTLMANIVTVRGIPDSSLIRVVARVSDPALAASIANTFAARAVAAATRASRIDVDDIEGELKHMLDEATERLRTTEKAYADFRVSARIEMLEREVETLVGQRSDLMDVVVELEGERARLARLEGELQKHMPVTSLKQSIVDDPALAEAARSVAPSRDLLGVQVSRETANTVFQNLDEEAAKARAHVASLEQQRVGLSQAAGLDGNQLSRFTQLYERESALERLDVEREVAKKSYEAVAARYQGARLSAIGRTPQLLIVDLARTPDEPLGRYLVRNTLLGITAGLLLGCITVMLRQALTGPGGS